MAYVYGVNVLFYDMVTWITIVDLKYGINNLLVWIEN